MLNIYLVRHGETEWNIEKRLQGWKDSNLTQKGIEDAEALHDHLTDIEFDSIYSSTSRRAFKTAEVILGERKLKIIADEKLREIYLGDWEGKTTYEIEQLYPNDYYNFWNAPSLYNPKNSETFIQVQERALKTINKIIDEKKSGNILIVTHGITLKMIMNYFEKQSLENLWETPYIQNTSVSLIQIQNREANILLYSDTSHIAAAY